MKIFNYKLTLFAKVLIFEMILSVIGIFIGMNMRINSENIEWNNKIYNGIRINGIDLGGKNRSESKTILSNVILNPIKNKKIKLITPNKDYYLPIGELIAADNVDLSINKALSYGKSDSTYKRYFNIKNGINFNMNLQFSINTSLLKERIKTIEGEINKTPVNASLLVDQGSFTLTPAVGGTIVDEEALCNEIQNEINSGKTVMSVKVPIKTIAPSISTESLSAIDSEISSYSTDYTSLSVQKEKNIELAASMLNGKILMPGETFSFNDTIGERTTERGFLAAPVLVGNSYQDGIGGGICEVSSTLYIASILSGITEFDRTHHSIPSTYVPYGLDATVDYGSIDFKFKNTLGFPLFIEAYTSNLKLYIKIYSNSSLNFKNYSLKNECTKTNDGLEVKVIRDTFEGETKVNTENISDDFYDNSDISEK